MNNSMITVAWAIVIGLYCFAAGQSYGAKKCEAEHAQARSAHER